MGARVLQETTGYGQLGLSIAGRHQPIVPDLGEARGKDVEQKTSDELVNGERDGSLLARVLVVPRREGHLRLGKVSESLV